LKRWGAGGADVFANKVKVIEGNGKELGWAVEEDFCVEAAADGVKEGGVGGRAESAKDVGSEGGVFNGEGSCRWGRGGGNVRGIRGLMGRGGGECGATTHSRWHV
jgi:hypothetical protein